MSAPTASDRSAWALLPLRAFLGFTFTFAGLQKLANPAFFNSSNPASIQGQLLAASRRSPVHALLHPLVHVAVPLGVLIALGEIAVGLGTLAGLLGRVAALGGLAISLSLFLTVSYHSSPYYTGADIVFAFAWLPFVVSGSGPFTLESLLGRVTARAGPEESGTALGRRTVLLRGTGVAVVAGVGVVAAGLAAGLGRLVGGHGAGSSPAALGGGPVGTTSSVPTTARATTSTAGPAPTRAPAPSTTTTAPHPPGTRLGPASRVPVGGSATFRDPRTGDPGVVVRPAASSFLAFDAVCPHAGCTVEYFASQRLFICPCHGSEFNGRTGAVEVGPAQSGLRPIRIAEGSDGDLYAE